MVTGSASCNVSSQTRTAREAPLASTRRSVSSASGGPIVTATTSPAPIRSVRSSASSTAASSHSFKAYSKYSSAMARAPSAMVKSALSSPTRLTATSTRGPSFGGTG